MLKFLLKFEYSADVNGLGTLRILEAIRSLNLEKKVKFYQAGTLKCLEVQKKKFQNEKTNFHPVSPYAVSKCFAHWITKFTEKHMEYHCM